MIGRLTICCAVFLVMLLCVRSAQANPTGGVVEQGAATISNSGSKLTINQSTDKVVINWQDFDIGSGDVTEFIQPSSSAIALNRIMTSGQLTRIKGALKANGHVIIVNPNGVLITSGATIDTAGFLASTANIDTDNFMASPNGIYAFDRAGKSNARIVNNGTITLAEAGLATLVAPAVENNGVITGRLSKVTLAAADTFAIDLFGDGLLSLAVENADTDSLSVQNTGDIIADGGRVMMTAADAAGLVENVVNSSGIVRANGLVNKGGEIILTADQGRVEVSGTLDTEGYDHDENRESIRITARDNIMLDNVTITADKNGLFLQSDYMMFIKNNSLMTTQQGGITAASGVFMSVADSVMGSRGGMISLSTLPSGILDLESTTLNAAGGDDFGSISMNVKNPADSFFLIDPDNRILFGAVGGAIHLTAQQVTGTENCLKSGGSGLCTGFQDEQVSYFQDIIEDGGLGGDGGVDILPPQDDVPFIPDTDNSDQGGGQEQPETGSHGNNSNETDKNNKQDIQVSDRITGQDTKTPAGGAGDDVIVVKNRNTSAPDDLAEELNRIAPAAGDRRDDGREECARSDQACLRED